MTSKFNKEMYDKIKGKKNEPLSIIGQKTLKIVDREKEKVAAERVRPPLLPPLPWTKDDLLLQLFPWRSLLLFQKRERRGVKGRKRWIPVYG